MYYQNQRQNQASFDRSNAKYIQSIQRQERNRDAQGLVIAFVILVVALIALFSWVYALPSAEWCVINYTGYADVMECTLRENVLFGQFIR